MTRLEYLDAACRETLRLTPIIPLVGRRLNSLAFNVTAVDVVPEMGPFEIAPGTQWDDPTEFAHGIKRAGHAHWNRLQWIERFSSAGLVSDFPVCDAGRNHQRMGAAIEFQSGAYRGGQFVEWGSLHRTRDHEPYVGELSLRSGCGEQQGRYV